MKQYESGIKGEALAEEYLCKKGMQVMCRRFRAQDGEIDLILRDGDTIVFTEVKSRPSASRGDGIAAVTLSKQRRITHAATAFLLEREWMEHPVRFDVVEITKDGLLHIPNAFMAVE